LGKTIYVVNRSYIEEIPNYPPSPYWVIIDAEGATTVTIHNVIGWAVLQGFTIQNGYDYYGGGVALINNGAYGSPPNNVPHVVDNLIISNVATYDGGGVYCRYGCGLISRDTIRNNTASVIGGGICIETSDYPFPYLITDNVIKSNICKSLLEYLGGGIGLNGTVPYANPNQWVSGINNNEIKYNRPSGIGSFDGRMPIRGNVIESNNAMGVSICVGYYNERPDLGTSNDPGKNILRDNLEYDLHYLSPPSINLNAMGNYWGTLHTSDIVSRIYSSGGLVDFDPIAASDRISSVTYNSECNTCVIVTGDLSVNAGVTLTIAHGKTFYFETTDDTNTGSYPDKCELIVRGELQADGTEAEKINFTSFGPVHQAGDWYGIRLFPYSTGNFDNCIIRVAYSGIDAYENSEFSIDSSRIEINQVYGINIYPRTHKAEIRENDINANIYGIRSDQASPTIAYNRMFRNERYGMVLINTDSAIIEGNQIDGTQIPHTPGTLHGIILSCIGEKVFIDRNFIENWGQGGVYCRYEANPRMNRDTILNNTYSGDGILCDYNSSPKVRWCTIDRFKSDVFCQGNSYPNLGTIFDAGYNSFLMGDTHGYWVVNYNQQPQSFIYAQLNWWGTDRPDRFRQRFIGPVIYNPWLYGPPEGGGQSADIIKPTLTFALYAPKPNPAKREVRITYSLPNRCKPELLICDVLGRTITNITEEKDAGSYEYLWNGKDQREKTVPNGIYIVRLKAGNNLQTQKITLAR
jgi:hypothetical protein